MPKKYLILNFSDYAHRTTPINQLRSAFARRVVKKGGSFAMYDMADLLSQLRKLVYRDLAHHPVEGLLDLAVIPRLLMNGTMLGMKWGSLMNDCRTADKIIFAAHGRKEDTNNIFCEDSMTTIRCGNVAGVNYFLNKMLGTCTRPDMTVTLVVCFGARSEAHEKHHVNEELTETDIRSALSFKIFSSLSKKHAQLRLTARTGATSGSTTTTSILSQTEEAIIASETRTIEFPGKKVEDLIGDAMNAEAAFEKSLAGSTLTIGQRKSAIELIDRWFHGGCEPRRLEEIIDNIADLDDTNRSCGLKVLECLCCCCCIDYSWKGNNRDTLDYLRSASRLYFRINSLQSASVEKLEKYGKFVYQLEGGYIIVSRWMKEGAGYRLTRLYRIAG